MKFAKFYITTPIFYVNAEPHIGHAYTAIATDILARWHRLKGEDVLFVTGTDEHGEKIEKAAEAASKTTKEFVDEVSATFKNAWKKLNISNDDFIRTTEERHKKIVKEIIEKVNGNGDIYKGFYEGYYCTGCESFKTETEIVDGKCPDHPNLKLKLLKEETYFFRLSKYQDQLLELYKKNPDFLSPKFRAPEIINRVKEGLKDLSITRQKLEWGIPFPLDESHVTYVWVEALINYISVLGGPNGKLFKKFWPADVHLVGKEINWFHSVIWPAQLMSAGLELPKTVFSHGWWTVEGQKMSKSLGNVIDPVKLAEKYSVDAVRYFLIRETPFGEDGEYSEKKFIERINGELVADLGNLVYRVLSLAEKFDGKIEGKPELESKLDVKKIDKLISEIKLTDALLEIWSFIRATNKYVNENEPWKLKGKELGNVIYNLLETTRVIAILISSYLPETAERISQQLGTKPGTLKDVKFGKFAGKVKKGKYLFTKIE
ncbi:methionine--tRNA ligase [archaeon]|nr:MAG: methionine--tRNA ligase [archaeon]